MSDKDKKIDQLLEKLEALSKRQAFFTAEIHLLKEELEILKTTKTETSFVETSPVESPVLVEKSESFSEKQLVKEPTIVPEKTSHKPQFKPRKDSGFKKNIEKFIGESLISKIGIIVTVIGVSIGAKYAIDNDLISPLTRIILGYLVGAGLLGFAIKLEKNYRNFSAVLLSGAMAIFYFLTYVAFSFYQFYSEVLAFIIMVIVTVFTVASALKYNKQVIAHIGLVGAYAVPFLLSDDPGQIEILFSYVAIINIGILVIAFKKVWKSLIYVSFALTWLIYMIWFTEINPSDFIFLSLFFVAVNFITFYTIFLTFKLTKNEKLEFDDILLILINTFLFYGLGSEVLDGFETGQKLLGAFTLLNAGIHLGVVWLIMKRKMADKNLYYLISGLVLLFITISIPVQLDGNWVTLLWAGEAALLFWIGRTKKRSFYEYLSYCVLILAFLSLLVDWGDTYRKFSNPEIAASLVPIWNIMFFSSLMVVVAFGYINYVNFKTTFPPTMQRNRMMMNLLALVIPGIFAFSLYNTFKIEIAVYWNQLDATSMLAQENGATTGSRNMVLSKFQVLWELNYTMFFLLLVSYLNTWKVKNTKLGFTSLGFNGLVIFFFLVAGLYEISELRTLYLDQENLESIKGTMNHLVMRYISLIFAGLLIYSTFEIRKQGYIKSNLRRYFDLFLAGSICWILSSELLNWLDINGAQNSYKLGLSIFWGIFSLSLIVIGIWKNKVHLRIAAMVLFGVTLIKLFFYDISHLDTISKTIVFLSLGVLLLIISFLYNKYKNKMYT